MGTIKQINVKNRAYCFYNEKIDLENFESNVIKIEKNHIRTSVFTILDILQLKKIGDYKNIYSVNPLCLRITRGSGYIEKINENKYLIFDSIDENKELKIQWWIMDKIKEVSNDECYYEKDYMKINFNSDDNLPLNKPLKFHNMTITVRSSFKEDGKLNPKVFLDDTFYELSP